MGDFVMGNEMFIFLDKLRDSGTMNMFGAPKVLEESFGLSKKEAREVFKAWAEYCSIGVPLNGE
jgi:hypothetical protein